MDTQNGVVLKPLSIWCARYNTNLDGRYQNLQVQVLMLDVGVRQLLYPPTPLLGQMFR